MHACAMRERESVRGCAQARLLDFAGRKLLTLGIVHDYSRAYIECFMYMKRLDPSYTLEQEHLDMCRHPCREADKFNMRQIQIKIGHMNTDILDLGLRERLPSIACSPQPLIVHL